jgi:hypothetical protein
MNNTIATPDKKIVSISGDPIKTKNTSTKEGVKLTEEEAIAKAALNFLTLKATVFYVWYLKQMPRMKVD